MSAKTIIVIVLLAVFAPVASADTGTLAIEITGAPLPDSPEDAPLTYAFSPAIRAAFARLSEPAQYTLEEQKSVE